VGGFPEADTVENCSKTGLVPDDYLDCSISFAVSNQLRADQGGKFSLGASGSPAIADTFGMFRLVIRSCS
jgi:hypothetical protein